MTTSLERSAGPATSATRTTVATLGLVAAFAGVEHAVGEVNQGFGQSPSLVFESWPDEPAFESLDGEPAMSLVPDLAATGVLAAVVAVALGVVAVIFADRRHGAAMLVGLSLLLLVVGGGFGPPLLGTLAGGLASRIDARPGRHPGTASRWVGRLWPWPLVVAVACFLGLVPGLAVLSGAAEASTLAGVAGVLSVGAFVSTTLAIWSARAKDLAA